MYYKKSLLTLSLLISLLPFKFYSQTPNSTYTIQENDWLSKISEKVYGNPHLYYRIIEGNNRKAESEDGFVKILGANDIKIGQKIWLPGLPPTNNLTGVPVTDCEIRLWYNYQIVAIGVINEKWKQEGMDLKTRAEMAFEMRHDARVNARFLMQDKEAVSALQARDVEKYGNQDGPTFEFLMQLNTDKGLTVEEAYQAIIDSSSKTDKRYNAECQ